MFIVTNSERYHVSAPDDPYSSMCGMSWTPQEASAVHEEPTKQAGLAICGHCEKKVTRG